MLINFCNNKLVKNVTCSTSECDGYEVTNLISNQDSKRKRGFLVDYFIKPPVTVSINFICEININYLIIWPRVGSQKTSGIEIFTSRCGKQYNSVASGSLNHEAGFLFCKYNDSCDRIKVPDNFFSRSFKTERFLQASFLQINIFRTVGSSIPALQKIEIWGELCSSCPKETVDTVINIWSTITACREENVSQKLPNSSDKELHTSDEVPDVSQLSVPDEFLDPITNEIMIIPMILPSGNIVDNTTLEKYVCEESKWGRLPSDPFTGKLFTKTSNPKVSNALKARIDKFLIDNCNEQCLKNLARRLGSDEFASGPRTSNLISCGVSNLSSRICKTTENFKGEQLLSKEGMSVFKNKRKLDGGSDVKNTMKDICDVRTKVTCLEGLHNTSVTKKSVTDASSYDKLKEQSLDSIMRKTLSNLPSFTNNNPSNSLVNCCKCNSHKNLYKLPCKHFICRSCLCVMTETNSCKCFSCSLTFGSEDPKKIHII